MTAGADIFDYKMGVNDIDGMIQNNKKDLGMKQMSQSIPPDMMYMHMIDSRNTDNKPQNVPIVRSDYLDIKERPELELEIDEKNE